MSGLEVAAASAAGSLLNNAGKQMTESSRERRREENRALVEAAKKTPGFQTAAEIRGKKLAIKEQWGLVIMRPLAKMIGVSRDYFETDFAKDFAEKIAHIPEDNLQTPKAIIAGPAMEGLGYSLDEPQLKAMYLKLLAHASDDRVATNAHPAFVEVIRQLTSEEAGLLEFLDWAPNGMKPIVRVRADGHSTRGTLIVVEGIMNLKDAATKEPVVNPRLAAYMDNWVRLGLVAIDYGSRLTSKGHYDWAAKRPEVLSAADVINGLTDPFDLPYTMVIENGILRATHFGAMFAAAAGLAKQPPGPPRSLR